MMSYTYYSMFTRRAFVRIGLTACILVFGMPLTVSAASYNLTTDKETFVAGDTFNVDVKISSPDVGINAGQATISFPKDTVEVTALDKSTSAFDFWLQGPSYSNENGQVSFIGGSQSGISGQALAVLRLTFRVRGAGAVNIIFSDGAVTASDGSGTNVLTAMNGLQLSSITKQDALYIKPPQIVRPASTAVALPARPVLTVPLYPNPEAWYANVSKFIVQWDLPKDVTDVATLLNQEPASDPRDSEGLFDNKTFSPLADGIWYLHVRFKNSVGWGATTHYRIGVDTAPPLSFDISSPLGFVTTNVAPTIVFATKDQPSGVRMYRVLVNNEVATTTALTSYELPPQPSGKRKLTVEAVDMAGNMVESRAVMTITETPLIIIAGISVTKTGFFVGFVFALIVALAFGWYLGRQQKERRLGRVVIAERDVQNLWSVAKKDVDMLLRRYEGTSLTKEETKNMTAALKAIADTMEKNGRYVVQNIEDIES